jgi:hypothetical protein
MGAHNPAGIFDRKEESDNNCLCYDTITHALVKRYTNIPGAGTSARTGARCLRRSSRQNTRQEVTCRQLGFRSDLKSFS